MSESDLLSFSVVKGDRASGGFGMNMGEDLTVTKITVPDGPAERAGVMVGVRIVEIEGEPVSSIEAARTMISSVPFGSEVLFRTIPPPARIEQGHFRPAELCKTTILCGCSTRVQRCACMQTHTQGSGLTKK